MTNFNLSDLASSITDTLSALEQAQKRVAFLERVLRQAIMTHGGKLPVDPQYGTEAIELQAELWVGGGEVSLVKKVGHDSFVTVEPLEHWGSACSIPTKRLHHVD